MLAVLLNSMDDAHLVWCGRDDTKTPRDFHRLLGGHLEFGEATIEGIRREIQEETGVDLVEAELLGVLENRFVYQEQPGHEIIFVYAGRAPSLAVPLTGGWLADNGQPIWVEWRSVQASADTLPPLYPTGVQEMISEMLSRRGAAS